MEEFPNPTSAPSPTVTEAHAASPVLRDLLAADRTRLANERTLLAYVRTAIGFLATGAGLLYLFDVRGLQIAGIVLAGVSVIILVIGVGRYRSVARDLAAFRADIRRSEH